MNSLEKILDISVAVLLLLCLFWAFGNALYIYFIPENKENALLAMQSLNPLIIVVALITSLVLALWVIFGRGVESRLWNWLPPFVCFRQFGSTGRKVLVVLLIIGTIFGMLGEFLGFPAAFWCITSRFSLTGRDERLHDNPVRSFRLFYQRHIFLPATKLFVMHL